MRNQPAKKAVLSQTVTDVMVSPLLSPSQIASSSPSLSPTNVVKKPNRSIYLGMWTQGMWDDTTLTFHPEKLHELEAKVGKKMAIAHFYTGWENVNKSQFFDQLEIIHTKGWRPMVSVNPYFFDRCNANGRTLYSAIAEGNCDDVLKDVATGLVRYGKPIFFRFAWEMNIESMGWGIQKSGSTPDEFIRAWRRIYTIVREKGGSNVIFVFSPNTNTPTSIPYASLYPGNEYVDWVALDGYNWGKTQSWSQWQSFTEVFSSSYYSLLSVASGKPMMIAEVNSTDIGGDKVKWYRSMLEDELPSKFPGVKAVVFFNEEKPQEGVNWRIDITPSTLVSFSQSIRNPIYISSF